jgi:integration host factor beta subunit
MTKSELVTHVAERLPYMSLKDAEIIVDTIFESMADALAQGDGIEVRGFGSFKVKDRGEREGRNPKTGESVRIPAKKAPFFRIGKELYERINQTVPATGSVED